MAKTYPLAILEHLDTHRKFLVGFLLVLHFLILCIAVRSLKLVLAFLVYECQTGSVKMHRSNERTFTYIKFLKLATQASHLVIQLIELLIAVPELLLSLLPLRRQMAEGSNRSGVDQGENGQANSPDL